MFSTSYNQSISIKLNDSLSEKIVCRDFLKKKILENVPSPMVSALCNGFGGIIIGGVLGASFGPVGAAIGAGMGAAIGSSISFALNKKVEKKEGEINSKFSFFLPNKSSALRQLSCTLMTEIAMRTGLIPLSLDFSMKLDEKNKQLEQSSSKLVYLFQKVVIKNNNLEVLKSFYEENCYREELINLKKILFPKDYVLTDEEQCFLVLIYKCCLKIAKKTDILLIKELALIAKEMDVYQKKEKVADSSVLLKNYEKKTFFQTNNIMNQTSDEKLFENNSSCAPAA